MKTVCFGLFLLGAGLIYLLHSQAQDELPYSPEFKKQARETLQAIERLERYTGALPQFEVDKALEILGNVSRDHRLPLDGSSESANRALNEQRAIRKLQDYKLAIELYHITEADKERIALRKVRDEVHALPAF